METTVTVKLCAAMLAPDQPWSSNNLAFLSFSLVHIGISLSHGPLLGSSLNDIPGIEVHNDYISDTWICSYCKNSNTSDKVKAWLTSSVSPHATVLPCRHYRYQFSVRSYLISVSASTTTGLFAATPPWVPSRPQRVQERPRSLPWVICSLGFGDLCIYFKLPKQDY